MKIQFTIITTLFVFCGGTPVPPTTRRPESPAYNDRGENQDPFFREREDPIDDATWVLWNQNPNQDCHGGNNTGISKFIFKLLSLNGYQLTIYALNLISFS